MPKRRTASKPDRESLLANAALKLLERQAWGEITLASAARSAKVSLTDVLSIVPSKSALPGFVLRALAREALRGHRPDAKSTDPGERLFDAAMSFFDVQQSHAAALKKLYRALPYDPPTLLSMRNDVLHVAGELLALAEADRGLSPQVQAAVFAGILIRAVSVWCEDDAEMGKTMVQLDSDLRRAHRFLWPKSGNADVPPSPNAKKRPPRTAPSEKNQALNREPNRGA